MASVPLDLKTALACASLVCVLVVAPSAVGAPPSLVSVSVQARHPSAAFSAPRSDGVTIYFSTKPDRATDGSFLTENIKTLDLLADSEAQSGRWLAEDQLDPGSYWVMLRASPDFATCWNYEVFSGIDPACADGYSNVLTLLVPKPASRYTARATSYRFLGQVTVVLTATPLGESRPYRVCYRTIAKRTLCTSGTLDGFSWNTASSDSLTVKTRALPAITTFNWFVGSSKVATKRIRVR